MKKSSKKKSLLDAYQFTNFKTSKSIKGKLGDKNARVLTLVRRLKKRVSVVNAENYIKDGMIARSKLFGTFRAAIVVFILNLRYVAFSAKRLV